MSWILMLTGLGIAAGFWELDRAALSSGDVLELVHGWDPANLDNDAALANGLVAWLRKRRPRWKVTSYSGGTEEAVDLAVEAGGVKIGLVVHKGLVGFPSYQRVVQQAEKAKRTWSTVLVVVCGETDPVLRYQLEDRLPGRDLATQAVVRVAFKDLEPRRTLRRVA